MCYLLCLINLNSFLVWNSMHTQLVLSLLAKDSKFSFFLWKDDFPFTLLHCLGVWILLWSGLLDQIDPGRLTASLNLSSTAPSRYCFGQIWGTRATFWETHPMLRGWCFQVSYFVAASDGGSGSKLWREKSKQKMCGHDEKLLSLSEHYWFVQRIMNQSWFLVLKSLGLHLSAVPSLSPEEAGESSLLA